VRGVGVRGVGEEATEGAFGLRRPGREGNSYWTNAGKAGGGGILNVESLEELDAILVEFPVGPFSEIEVVPITELQASLERSKQMFAAMAGG
jgi:muconolactone delta-isomerase